MQGGRVFSRSFPMPRRYGDFQFQAVRRRMDAKDYPHYRTSTQDWAEFHIRAFYIGRFHINIRTSCIQYKGIMPFHIPVFDVNALTVLYVKAF